jgi:sugar transferase (PEP-CTERM/EpsH1 system associated)
VKNLLFIAHRMPWPLDKGEKIRAWQLIRHLATTYRVHLGVIVDDPSDMAHVNELRTICADVGAFAVDRRQQRVRALLRARPGRPLMPDCYFTRGLQDWIDAKRASISVDILFIYTVAMAPYVLRREPRPPTILDAVDIDSEKWREYASKAAWPTRAVWAREARTLFAFEREAAASADATLFVSAPESDRFRALAPELSDRVFAVENGVDLQKFDPALTFESPFAEPGPDLVFTGNMDYWPNADAVNWFAREVLPRLRNTHRDLAFWIVGANPGPNVQALTALPGVYVTGRVADVRPYVAHADCIVCPLRIARGIQNKVLEAMAMGRPVVASRAAFEGVRAEAGIDLLVADGAEAFVAAVIGVLAGRHPGLGASARAAMQRGYAWSAVLQALDRVLERVP